MALLAALGVLLITGAIAAVVMLRARDTPSPGRGRPLIQAPVGVSPEGQELLRLLAVGRSRPLHARYSISDGARLELWRSGDRYRQDTEIRGPDGVLERSVSIHRPEGDVTCRRSGDGAWTCRRAAAPPAPEAAVVSELEGRSVTARDASIAGAAARCFTVSGSDQSAELCLDSRGTLLVLATGDARLELEDADESVAPRVFEPPAPVSG